jgi:hypothetical protein
MGDILDNFDLLVLSVIQEPVLLVDAIIKTRLAERSSAEWEFSQGPLDRSSIYIKRPQRGGAQPIHVAMWTPKNRRGYTAFYPNSSDGWSLLVRRLSKMPVGPVLQLRSSKANAEDQIQELDYIVGGVRRRFFQLILEDDGWHYVSEGAPLSAEPEVATPAQAGERVTRDVVIGCVKELGIDLRDEAFWQADGDAFYIREIRPTACAEQH